jgi:hypothetical protein
MTTVVRCDGRWEELADTVSAYLNKESSILEKLIAETLDLGFS